MANQRIALIDGDVLAHIACKNPWERLQNYRGIQRNNPRFKFKPDSDDDINFSAAEATRYTNESWLNFKNHMRTTLEAIYVDSKSFKMAVKGDNNYRDLIYSEYKANRKGFKIGGEFPPIMRAKAVYEKLAVFSEGREADDLLRIWAEEAKAEGKEPIICSNDKDLHCIVGQHWNVKKNEFKVITEDYAIRFYFEQLLQGDPVDNIPGVPSIGPITAKKLLADCTKENEFQEMTLTVYKAAYGDEWKNQLLANGKMIYIQKHLNDYFTILDWKCVQEEIAKEMLLKLMEEEPQTSLTLPSLQPKITPKVVPKLAPPATVLEATPKVSGIGSLRVPRI